MARKVDVLIYIEHVLREMDAAVLLRYRLKAIGITSVIVPIHFDLYWNLLIYRPKIIAVPFCYSKDDIEIFEKCYVGCCLIANLHHEQISGPDAWAFMLPSDQQSKSVIHLAWGAEFAKRLLECGCSEETVFEVGSIRAEAESLLAQNQYTQRQARMLQNVLVALNFGFAFYSEAYIENIIQRGRLDAAEEQIRAQIALGWFSKELAQVIQGLPHIHFEIRAHPSDPPEAYTELHQLLAGFDNVTFRQDETIQQRLMAVDVLLTWTSTTALEAQLLNVPSACLINEKDVGKMDYIALWNHFGSASEVLNWINGGCSVLESMKEYLIEVYGPYYLASEHVAAVLAESILHQQHVRLRLAGICFLVYKLLTVDIPKRVLHFLGLLERCNPLYARMRNDLLIKDAITESDRRLADFVKMV